MFKKQLSAKSVTVIVFVVPVLGALSEIYSYRNNYLIGSLSGLISSLNLSWLNMRHWSANNVFNWIFYGLLLLGAILLVLSKGKETRLPRFAFALILFHKALFSLYAVYTLFVGGLNARYGSAIPFFILYMITRLAWMWLAWNVLAYFNKKKELEIQSYTYGQETATSYVTASWGQRFMNLLIDSVMEILLFSLLIELIIYSDLHNNILMKFQAVAGDKLTLVVIIVVCRLLYYIPFELLMGTTPAKYLTETQVVTNDGGKLTFGIVFKRTLARFIPFESFSFLVGDAGWHDRISDTSVIKEKRTGVSGSRYFSIIPVGLLLWALGYWGYIQYAQYMNHREINAEQERVKVDMISKLDNVNPQDFFQLRSVGSSYYETPNLLLKAENVSGDKITFSVIPLNGQQRTTQQAIEKMYQDLKGTFKKVSFNKQALSNAIKPPHSEQFDASNGISINGNLYYIGSIDRYYQANIQLSERGGYGDHYINIGLISNGWTADVTRISAEEGDITFNTFPPIHLAANSYYNSGLPFEILGKIENGSDFKIDFTVRDTMDREQVYQVSGNCKEPGRILKRLK